MAKKAEVCVKLETAGVEFDKKETLPELRHRLKLLEQEAEGETEMKLKEDPMTGLSSRRKEDIQIIAYWIGVNQVKGKTCGELLLAIRATLVELETKKLSFGKYKGLLSYKEALQKSSYAQWAMKETTDDSAKGLREYAMFCHLYFGTAPDSRSKSKEEKDESPPTWTKVEKGTIPKEEPQDSDDEMPTGQKRLTKKTSQSSSAKSTGAAATKAPPPPRPPKSAYSETDTAEEAYEKLKVKPPQWTGRKEDWTLYLRQVQDWNETYGDGEDRAWMSTGSSTKRK